MQKERIVILLQRYVNKTITTEETLELAVFVQQPSNKEVVISALTEAGVAMPAANYDEARFEPILKSILSADDLSQPDSHRVVRKHAPVHSLWSRRRWAVAASVILLLGTAALIGILTSKKDRQPAISNRQPAPDVKAPETNRATITLADGSTVYLDSAGSGALAQQGNMQLVKLADGQIAYQAAKQDAAIAIQYNTLMNPRGSKVIDITLADGSRVWLNAGTSITYPVAFAGPDRTVAVNGEAYFEVAPDKTKPFLVNTGNAYVKVLGTHFNVMNYSGEPAVQTTLLEGSVQVITGGREMLLKPGQQSNLEKDGNLTLANNVDVELVTAWKNGLQSFRQADLKTLMRQVERWYDIKVVYETEVPAYLSFTGEGIPRNVSLRELLKVLENNELKFEIDADNRKISVKKNNR